MGDRLGDRVRLFQSLNRRAIRGIEDPYVSTFLQLSVATAILVVASLVSEDLSQLGDASGEAIALFALAGIIHFVLGWLLLNVSQMRSAPRERRRSSRSRRCSGWRSRP